MITKIKNMSYGAARYYVLKELDERDDIGRLLLSYDPQLAIKMMDFCDWIDKANIAYGNNDPDSIDWRKAQDIPNTLVAFAEKFPFLTLSASELNWEGFLSAWLTIANEFVNILEHHMRTGRLPEDDFRRLEQMARACQDTLRPVYTLAELGAGYLDLIKAGSELMKEIQKWRQSQPSAIRLSQAYLKAVGIIKDEEEGPKGHNPPPPPPSAEGPRCNCNETTPPSPPPPPHDGPNN